MDFTTTRGELHLRPAGLAALFVFEDDGPLAGVVSRTDRACRGAVRAALDRGDFRGGFLDTALLYPARVAPRRLLLVGLGRRAEFTPHRLRQAAATAARRARDLRAGTCTLALPETPAGADSLAQVAAEGAVLGHHLFTAYRTGPQPPALRRTVLVEAGASRLRAIRAAAARGARWAEATCLARDLAHTPGQDLVPEQLAARAREIAEASGATATVLRVPQLERLGAGGLLAVGRGSANPPCLIVIERAAAPGRRNAPTVVVIGKGVTFDTGGISIKPRENMHKMKYDMSGAAAVLGMFAALPPLPFRVVGIVPAAENMPGGRAFKPGDVLRTLDGATVEVTNTDAEGRLLLADALAYARRYEPETVVDLATLTGAVSVALGFLAAGLFTDDGALSRELFDAADAAGERLWRLPMWDEYAADLKSDVADLANSPGVPQGAASAAAAFLKRFAAGMRWAHLDIASTAWAPADRPHERRGPTGFGVRLLLEWLTRRAGALSAGASPAPPPAASARRAAAARGRARLAGRSPRG
jgi:leucyl aminopeptidase